MANMIGMEVVCNLNSPRPADLLPPVEGWARSERASVDSVAP